MTRMSDSHALRNPCSARICAGTLERSAVARAVHDYRTLVRFVSIVAAAVVGGCVIPPSLSVADGDAGVNSPPAILAVRNDIEELSAPGPVYFERGLGTLNATLYETDLTDTLYVRVFVDYTVMNPTAARSTCTARCTEPCATQRSVTCDLGALCLQADIGVERFMTVEVFDREPLEFGDPRFKAMPPGGQTTGKSYKLICQERST